MLSILLVSLLITLEAETEIIRLKIGEEIVAEVVADGFDEASGVTVRRVGDGSLLTLRWDQMHPDDVRRIRASFGYLPDEPEPIFVEATRVTLARGTELLGFIVEQDEETFRLRQGNRVIPLRWSGLRSRETVLVDVLEVYDAEEYYTQELYSRDPQTALDHYNLALTCESLQLWNRVLEHLDRVEEIDPGFKTTVVGEKRKRAELRSEAGVDAEVLARATRLAKREQYDDALYALDEFLGSRPGSSLTGEAVRERRRIERQRGVWVKSKVSANFFAFLERYAHRVAADGEVTAAEGRKLMDQEATPATMEAVATYLEIAPEEVQALWEDEDRPLASPRVKSYGAGTFTLGNQRALADLEKDDKKKDNGQEGGRKAAGEKPNTLEDRIKQELERKRAAREQRRQQGPRRTQNREGKSQRRIVDVPPTQDEWWAAARLTERVDYLLAFWAERNPHVRILKISPRRCAQCSGEGFLKFASSNVLEGKAPCSRCKTLGIDRVVHYR